MIKVSVIVPVYGVERYIEKCIKSLLFQSYDNYEIIIVNDCTKDKSIEIIKTILRDFPSKDVKIIHHKKNIGLPSARNSGLKAATGEYIYHVDGDDFTDPEMISDMVKATDGGKIDIVYSNWYLSYGNSERYMTQPATDTPSSMLESILKGRMKYNVWNKLVRRSLYVDNAILFPEGYGMGEDMTMIKIAGVAKSVNYLPKAYYHYVKVNTGAMTENLSEKSFRQIDHNVNSTVDFLLSRNHADEHLCQIFKLTVKYPLLFTSKISNYKKWRSWFPKSNEYACDNTFGLHTKIVQWMAAHGMNRLLKLHFQAYTAAYKLIYK